MDDIFLLKRKMHAENLLEGNYDLSGIEPRTERVGNDLYVIYDIENTWLRSRTFVELIHYENGIAVVGINGVEKGNGIHNGIKRIGNILFCTGC